MSDKPTRSVEQVVRDILEAQGNEDAQSYSAGDVLISANILAKYLREVIAQAREEERRRIKALLEELELTANKNQERAAEAALYDARLRISGL